MTTASKPLGMLTLLRAAGSLQDFVESKLAGVALSIPKLAALQRLADAGGTLPLGQLAERLACVKSNVTQLVDRLEADGLVTRKPDPRDRRTKLAVLTAAGRKAVKDGGRMVESAEREVLSRLTRDEAQELSSLLAKIGTPNR